MGWLCTEQGWSFVYNSMMKSCSLVHHLVFGFWFLKLVLVFSHRFSFCPGKHLDSLANSKKQKQVFKNFVFKFSNLAWILKIFLKSTPPQDFINDYQIGLYPEYPTPGFYKCFNIDYDLLMVEYLIYSGESPLSDSSSYMWSSSSSLKCALLFCNRILLGKQLV